MLPIKYKFVLDEKGVLTGVELWQGHEHITVSMAAEGTHRNGYRWLEVKGFLDNVVLPVYNSPENDALRRFNEMYPVQATKA